MNKRGLGRGLGALLSSTPVEGESLVEIPLERIGVNPNQPRKAFDQEALAELSASIKASGIIQPVVVRRRGDGRRIEARRRQMARALHFIQPQLSDRMGHDDIGREDFTQRELAQDFAADLLRDRLRRRRCRQRRW